MFTKRAQQAQQEASGFHFHVDQGNPIPLNEGAKGEFRRTEARPETHPESDTIEQFSTELTLTRTATNASTILGQHIVSRLAREPLQFAPGNPNNRTTTLDWSSEWNGEWIVENSSTRLIPKSKQPKTLRQTVNRKADAKRYGEQVEFFRAFRRSEPVDHQRYPRKKNSETDAQYCERVALYSSRCNQSEEQRQRIADGLSDYLSTLGEASGDLYIRLREGRPPASTDESTELDEHNDRKPVPVFSLGRQAKNRLSTRSKRRLRAAMSVLGDQLSELLVQGYTNSECALELGITRYRVNQLRKAARLAGRNTGAVGQKFRDERKSVKQ